MLRWAMALSPDGHGSPAERKRRRERERYARKQESRGVAVKSQRGRPRRNPARLARTAAAAWWASQIPKWESDFQRRRAERAVEMARRVVLLADVCMHDRQRASSGKAGLGSRAGGGQLRGGRRGGRRSVQLGGRRGGGSGGAQGRFAAGG